MAIKGSLKEASLPDVVQLLYLGRRTGCLSVANDRNFASIWLDDGWVVFAGMISRPDRLGERLIAAGKLTHEQLQAAIASGDPARAMPALANLRQVPAEQAIPLLLIISVVLFVLMQSIGDPVATMGGRRPTRAALSP